MPRRRKIAVLVESSRGYGRGLLHGVANYVREHGPWTIHNHERRLYDAAPEWLRRWRGDGIIARIANPRFARQISRLRVPTVDLLGLHHLKNVPVIITDHRAVARLAADHLLDRGLVHFAFCGFAGIHFSERRSEYFVEYLTQRGYAVSVYTDPASAQPGDAATIEGESSASGGAHRGMAEIVAEAGRLDGRYRRPRPSRAQRVRGIRDRRARRSGGDRRGQRRDALRFVRSAAVERGPESAAGRL